VYIAAHGDIRSLVYCCHTSITQYKTSQRTQSCKLHATMVWVQAHCFNRQLQLTLMLAKIVESVAG
jgi:hypothetical protein